MLRVELLLPLAEFVHGDGWGDQSSSVGASSKSEWKNRSTDSLPTPGVVLLDVPEASLGSPALFDQHGRRAERPAGDDHVRLLDPLLGLFLALELPPAAESKSVGSGDGQAYHGPELRSSVGSERDPPSSGMPSLVSENCEPALGIDHHFVQDGIEVRGSSLPKHNSGFLLGEPVSDLPSRLGVGTAFLAHLRREMNFSDPLDLSRIPVDLEGSVELLLCDEERLRLLDGELGAEPHGSRTYERGSVGLEPGDGIELDLLLLGDLLELVPEDGHRCFGDLPHVSVTPSSLALL